MNFQPPRRRALGSIARALAFLTIVPTLGAQAQTGRPIRLIVPLAAGSTVDAVARAMSNQMSKVTGHPIVVDNLPGAGGMTGTLQLVNAAKDGSTLGLISSNHVINPSIYKKVPYDTLTDITPISVIGTVPLVLVVNPAVPARNLAELVALMKAKPGVLNLGSAGNGSVLHLAGEMFGSEAGVQIKHIPYRGTGPFTTELLGGHVDMGFISVTAAAPYVRAGTLRAIGVSTPARSPILPDVPSLSEVGLPHYSFDAWIALVGPAGLPKTLINKAYADLKTVLAQKEVSDALAIQGITVIAGTPDQAGPFFKAELDKHAGLVKKSGATME